MNTQRLDISTDMSQKNKNTKYISALRYNLLTVLYDPIMQWLLREKSFKNRLILQANIHPGHRVLDLGCGTATLTALIKEAHPEADVFGLDGDPKVLDIARSKIKGSGLDIKLQASLSFEMSFPENSFDRVLSSLLFHHLTPDNKRRTLNEIYRVLKPGGELHIVDLGKPKNQAMRGAVFLVQLLDGFATTRDIIQGKLPRYMGDAGFFNIEEKWQLNTPFGSLCCYRGNPGHQYYRV